MSYLPFGSSDASIILQEDLQSLPSEATAVGAPIFGADGMLCPTTGDKISFTNLAGADKAANAGQISIGVDAVDIAAGTSEERHDAGLDSTQGYILSTNSNGGAWNSGISINAGGALTTQNRFSLNAKTGATTASSSSFRNSLITPDKSILTMSWIGRNFSYYQDGVFIVEQSAATDTDRDWLYNIYIGGRGLTSAGYVGRTLRDIQIAKRPIVLAQHPLFQRVVTWGDSYANAKDATTVVGYGFQCGKMPQFRKVLFDYGFGMGSFTAANEGGHTVQDNGAQPLQTNRANVAAADPTIILFQAGPNDFGVYDSATFRTDMKDHLDFMVANCPHLQGFVIGELPANMNTGRYGDAYAQSVNADYHSMVDYWNTTYPGLAGRLVVTDTYSKCGLDTRNFGIADTLHPCAIGAYRFGKAWGEAAMRIVTSA